MADDACQADVRPRRSRGLAVLVAVAAVALASVVAGALPAAADTVIDTITGAGGSSDVGSNAVAVSPDGSTVYTANGTANTISFIDASTNVVVRTIAASGGPSSVVVSPDGSRVYVTLGATSVLVIDAATGAVVATVPVGDEPTGIAVSPDGTRVYTANVDGNSVSVIDTATNATVTTISGIPDVRSVAVSSDGSRLYVGQYSVTNHDIVVIDTATNTVATSIATGAGIANSVVAMAFSPDGTLLYGATRAAGVLVVDTTTDTVVGTIVTGNTTASGLDVTPDGTRAYVTNNGTDTVKIIDLAANAVVDTITVGDVPAGVRVTPDGLHAYVNNAVARTVSVLALDTFPSIVTTSLPGGTGGTAYAATIATTGSPSPQLTVSAGAFPPGLVLDPATGAITGKPTAVGSYTFTVTASSTVSGIPATAARSYTVAIAAVPAIAVPVEQQGTGASLAESGVDSSGWLAAGVVLSALGGALALASFAWGRRHGSARLSGPS